METRLVAFGAADPGVVVDWVRSPEEAVRWAGVVEFPAPAATLREWHADPDVVPFLLVVGGDPVAYGELWEDESEVELARLVVAPKLRGRGLGHRLVEALVTEAERRGFDEIWLRVVPDNEIAIRCYRAAGFTRTTPEEEAGFNHGQPRAYVWMRYGPPVP